MESRFTTNKKILEDKMIEPNPYSAKKLDERYDEKILSNANKINNMNSTGILADKVYSFCQLRDCFPKFKIDIHDISKKTEFDSVIFQEGYIERGTLEIIPFGSKRPNFSRIKFTLKVPFTLNLRNNITREVISMNGLLPEIKKDIIMYLPEAREEFDFRVIAETRSETISPPEMSNNQLEIPIGIFTIIRIVGRVQLLIPTYNMALEPPEAEFYEDIEKNICQTFDQRDFPNDFFPLNNIT